MSTHAPPQRLTRLWTVAEIAEYFSVHEDTIRRKIAAGQLPSIKLGDDTRNALRVREDDLTDRLKQHAQ
jgi:excisionase family DNA binding protein